MTERLHNVNVLSSELLPTPEAVKQALPLPTAVEEFVYRSRGTLRRILDREDPRLFVVVGPCSIHDPAAAREYALSGCGRSPSASSRTLFVLMRVYFEKPRTTVGWKGLINDPDMDDSFHIEKGIHIARELLLDLGGNRRAGRDRGARSDHAAVPVGAHHLDGDRGTHHGIADPSRDGERPVDAGRASRTALTARSTVAINALQSARHPHHFLGITQQGQFGGVSHAWQRVRPHRAARWGRADELRFSQHRALRARARAGAAARSTSSSIAATATRTRILRCSRWSRRTSATRSSKATARSSG